MPVIYFLIANTAAAMLYYIFARPYLARQERLCGALTIFFVPAGGLPLVILSTVRRREISYEGLAEFIPAAVRNLKNRKESYCGSEEDESTPGESVLLAENSDITGKTYAAVSAGSGGMATSAESVNRNAVSFYDILLTADNYTKRSVLLDIFRGKPHHYIKQLKAALDDFDTETSHYASVALVEIKRKYDNRLIALGDKLKVSPDDLSAACEYADIVKNYIGSKILDAGNENRLKQNYIRVMEKYLENGEKRMPVEYYTELADYVLGSGDYEKAASQAVKTIELFPDDERPYFMLMKVYYEAKEREKFAAVLEKLKKSDINISRDGLSKVRYFSGKY